MKASKVILPLSCATLVALGMATAPTGANEMSGEAMFSALKGGGYVVYFRHSLSDTSQNDADPIQPENCATQRNLSEPGRTLSRKIGATLTARGIQIEKVYTSAYCRAKDTATLAFSGMKPEIAPALFYSLALPKDAATKAAADLKAMLAAAPAAGKNVVMVGHTSNLKEVAGVWPKKEGSAYVFKPDGKGGFVIAGTLDPADFDKAPGS